MCAIVPLFPHSLQFGSSTRPHWCRFTGDGSVSYTDLSRNEILNWSFLHSSVHVNSRAGRSHFIKAPCFMSSVDLAFLLSSSVRRTSAWTMVRPSAADAFDHCRKWDIPTPCHLVFVFPMMCLVCVAFSLLGPLMFLHTTSFLSLFGSQLLQFCCLPSPATSFGYLDLPPQRILASLVTCDIMLYYLIKW